MSRFTVKDPGFFRSAADRWRYRHHYVDVNCGPLSSEEEQWVESIKENGFAQIQNFIKPEILRELQEQLQGALERLEFETPCLAQSRIDPVRDADLLTSNIYATTAELTQKGLTFDRSEIRSYDQTVDQFQPSTLTLYMLGNSAAYRQVWLDERLLRCVCAYLGMVPYLAEAYVRRNFPAPYRNMNHFWHRDLNSAYLLKVFFFLSDCRIESGPHEFISGTHRQFEVLNGKRYFDDSEVDQIFPPGSPRRMVSEVQAGTVIIEDTRGLHRARVPDVGFRDLGYGVFMPMDLNHISRLYTVNRSSLTDISSLQQRFIPPSYVVGG